MRLFLKCMYSSSVAFPPEAEASVVVTEHTSSKELNLLRAHHIRHDRDDGHSSIQKKTPATAHRDFIKLIGEFASNSCGSRSSRDAQNIWFHAVVITNYVEI